MLFSYKHGLAGADWLAPQWDSPVSASQRIVFRDGCHVIQNSGSKILWTYVLSSMYVPSQSKAPRSSHYAILINCSALRLVALLRSGVPLFSRCLPKIIQAKSSGASAGSEDPNAGQKEHLGGRQEVIFLISRGCCLRCCFPVWFVGAPRLVVTVCISKRVWPEDGCSSVRDLWWLFRPSPWPGKVSSP